MTIAIIERVHRSTSAARGLGGDSESADRAPCFWCTCSRNPSQRMRRFACLYCRSSEPNSKKYPRWSQNEILSTEVRLHSACPGGSSTRMRSSKILKLSLSQNRHLITSMSPCAHWQSASVVVTTSSVRMLCNTPGPTLLSTTPLPSTNYSTWSCGTYHRLLPLKTRSQQGSMVTSHAHSRRRASLLRVSLP
jgi:hypothetical protein